MKKLKTHNATKVNVIPILDAVFIFVFFLLMSVQFIEIYQHTITTSKTSSEPPQTKEKPKDMLKIVILNNQIELRNLQKNTLISTFNASPNGLDKLKAKLVEIKVQDRFENSVILSPKKNISYKKIVNVLDVVKHKGRQKNPLFKSVAFESL